MREIKPFLGNKAKKRDTIVGKVFGLARLTNFYSENTTYRTLINSGDLKLINNFKLRRGIQEHYSFHKIVSLNYKRLEEIHKSYFADLFINVIDYNELRKGNNQCIESNKSLLEKINNELSNK